MAIKSIEISNFKGISHLEETFDYKPKYIGGHNGKGKTSFLEALRYALTGKTPTREEILAYGQEGGFVRIVFDNADRTEITREFYGEGKPAKVRVNGKTTTAKSAQELICSLLVTNGEYLNLNTSQDVFKELLKGELGKFLLSFVPENFTTEKLFELVSFSDAEKEALLNRLPETFGLNECEAVYAELFAERANLKVSVQKAQSLIPETIPTTPVRAMEDVEKELASILAAEQIARANASAKATYERALAAYNKRVADIKTLENEIAAFVAEPVDPMLKETNKKHQQEVMSSIATGEALIRTLNANTAMFEKTLANLNTNICPISAKLICTTDKTAAKTEFENLIAENKRSVEEQQNIIAGAKIKLDELRKEETNIVAKEQAVERKNNLLLSLSKSKAALGEPPVMPTETPVSDITKKPQLLAEKENIFRYNEYLKNKASFETLAAKLEVIASLTKKFAPKGIVTENIIGFYCEIFNDEIRELTASIDFEITFKPQNGLSLLVKPGEDKSPVMFDNLSAGEQLLTTVIVQHLCNTLSGSNIMLIDNFNNLDQENTELFQTVLDELAIDYQLLVIAGTNI